MTTPVFTLEDGNQLEIPIATIIFVEVKGTGGCTIVYQVGKDRQVDKLTSQYGFVKKAVIDGGFMPDAIEMDVASDTKKHKIFVSKARVVAKRGLQKDDNGGKLQVSIDINGTVIPLIVKQKFEDI